METADQQQSGKMLSINDLANRWDVSKNTIYKWRSLNLGPRGIKLGKHLRFRLSDVEAFESSQLESARFSKDVNCSDND